MIEALGFCLLVAVFAVVLDIVAFEAVFMRIISDMRLPGSGVVAPTAAFLAMALHTL